MSRTITLSALVLAGALSVTLSAFQAPQAAPRVIDLLKLKDNLYVLTSAIPGDQATFSGGNVSVFITDAGVTLVDSKLAGWGQAMMDKIKTVTNKPVTRIVNTHTHGDHTGNNDFFGASVEVVAHENTKANMEKMKAFAGEKAQFLPKKTYKDKLTIGSGKDQIDLFYFGPGHTNGDTIAPDGSRVAVQRQVSGGSRVELYETTTSQSTTLCDDCLLNGGGWSSDGARLLITRGFPARQRPVVIEVGSGREQELTTDSAWNIFQAHYSADDRWVTFHTTNAPDLRQVYAVPAFLHHRLAPDAWVPVTTDFGIYPAWSPDAGAVYHFSLRDGYMCAWLQPVDPASKRPAGPPRAVQHFHQPRLRAALRTNPTNDVNEGFMYVTLTETTGNIWSLDMTSR